MEEFCAACGWQRAPGAWVCAECGCDVWATSLPGHLVGKVSAKPSREARVFGFLAGKLFIAPGDLALLAGPPGAGKSTLALGLFRRPWWASSEMGAHQVAGYAQRVGAELAGVGAVLESGDPEPWASFGDLERAAELEPDTAPDLVIDSVTACRHPLAVLEAARWYARTFARRVCLIAHFTKDGRIRGTADLPHLVDHVITMEPDGNKRRRMSITKTRRGPTWSGPYDLGAAGVTVRSRQAFYSVEGPPYQLRAHPSPGAKYAAVLREAERDDGLRECLPPPPVAVAALKSALYPGGWAEPDDAEERAAFAQDQGVPYWSPLATPAGYDDPELEARNEAFEARRTRGQTP